MMPRSILVRTLAAAWGGILLLGGADARAQSTMNPLVGAWSGRSPDGSIAGTDVYNADGTFIGTARVSNGAGSMLLRVFARYRARRIGPDQILVESDVVGYLPRQICSAAPGGLNCQPFALPDFPTSMTITLLDENTIKAKGVVSHRDDAPALSQMQVPDVVVVQGGGSSGAVSTCAEGTSVCDPSGWRKFCERWPDGHLDYKFHGVHC